MKTTSRLIALALLVFVARQLKSQTVYHFPVVHNPAACAYTYDISITIQLDSVKVTNIYFDDGITGSFGFRAYFSYANVFSNSTLPPGSFYTFDLTVYSDNPNLNSPTLTNNLGTVPLETAAAGGYSTLNNPTYNASASALGLGLGGSYNAPAVLNTLGYDSAVLRINLPCLDTTMAGTDDATLPVLWSRLKATRLGNGVQLSWHTFTEQHNAGFTIERSADGMHWVHAGFVPSMAQDGNSSITLYYDYSESSLQQGRYFYRIIQRDNDGRQTISNVVSFRIADVPGSGNLLVYPNPATAEIYLRNVQPNSPFIIYDNHGRLLLRGNYRQPVDVRHFSPGIYWIRVKERTAGFILR